MELINSQIGRRQFLRAGMGASALLLTGAAPGKESRMGLGIHSFGIRSRAAQHDASVKSIDDAINFLEYSHSLGAGGVQVRVPPNGPDYLARLRSRAESYGMFIQSQSTLPVDETDLARFDADLQAANSAGADVMRLAMGGRRYEDFDRLEQFHAYEQRIRAVLRLAEPAAARNHVRLAIENHKDLRVPEFVRLLEEIGSEYVGTCVDVGNSIALLENPDAVVDALAPWAHSVHLKDAIVQEYPNGFLLGDVPLGQGIFDLPSMVQTLRQHHPGLQFSLEMITRDPLPVPCLTDKYWATFPDVAGRELAGMLQWVRLHAHKDMPQVSSLPLQEQIALEEDNVKQCLAYARKALQL